MSSLSQKQKKHNFNQKNFLSAKNTFPFEKISEISTGKVEGIELSK